MRQVTPDEAFAERLREAREGAKMTRAELADRLVDLVGYVDEDGKPVLSEQAIGGIERSAVPQATATRRVTLSDAFALAAALDVAPINLMVPFESKKPTGKKRAEGVLPFFAPTAELKVGEHMTFVPGWARAWIKGVRTRFEAGPREVLRFYVEEVPPDRRWRNEELQKAVLAGDRDRICELLRVRFPDDDPHRMETVHPLPDDVDPQELARLSRPPGLPAALWALMTDQPKEGN